MSSHYFVVPISTNRLSSFQALHYWQVYVLYTESRYPCLIMWSRTPDFSLFRLVFMGSVASFVFISLKVFFPACVWSFILFIPMYVHDRMLATCLHGICLHVPSHLFLCVIVVSSVMIIRVSGLLSILCNSAHLWIFLIGFFFSCPFFFSFVNLMSMT